MAEIDLYARTVKVVKEGGVFCIEIEAVDMAGRKYVIHVPTGTKPYIELREKIAELAGWR